MSKVFRRIMEAVEDGEREEVVDLVEEALEDEADPAEIMNKGLIAVTGTIASLRM